MGDSRVTADDRVWQQLRRRVHGIARASVRVGVVGEGADATAGSEDGDASLITMAELAAIHELGAPAAGIPARSFIRKTFELKLDELKGLQFRLCRRLLDGSITVEQAMGILGAWGAAAIRKTVTSQLVEPKLADSEAGRRTIARKGSSVTLVDTGALINAVTWITEGV